MKRIMKFFLALVMFMAYLPLNPITSYANDDVANGNVNDGVKIDDVFSDENFKNYVSKNLDKDKNGYLSDDEVAAVTELSIGKQGISSLNGIGFFKNLTKLDCSENEIESLDISNNTKLFFLDCSINKLNRLDVSKNTKLTTLYCHTNQLTNLDVLENTNLTKLICNENNLTYLFVGYNLDLTELNCNNNKLKNLYVARNENLTNLWCAYNELERLDLGYNKNLTKLGCNNNKLESLDVSEIPNLTNLYCSGNKLTSLDLSKNKNLTKLDCGNQQYNISINKDTREFKYSNFPGKFNKDKVTSPAGASFGNDALTVDSNNPSEVTYNYKVAEGKEMNVKLNVTYKDVVKTGTDPKVQVTEGYTRVTFDAGDGNTIDGNRYKVIDVLTGTAWDNAEVTKEIPASAKYQDNTKVFDKWKEAVPKAGNVETKKFTAEYKKVVKTGNNPNETTPDGYTRVTFDADDGNTIDGNRYKVIDVLTGTEWNNAEVTKEIPKSATYKDTTKVFKEWKEAVPKAGNVETKTFKAKYKKVVKTSTDPNVQVTEGYTRVTFDAGEGNTIDGTNNRYKVIDVLTGTAWNNAEVTKELPKSAKYKDNTKEFKEWDSTVPDTGEVQEQEFTAVYKNKDLVKIGTDPKAQVPDGYTRVTFDAGEGNTIDGTNDRYKVIDVLTGTAWDNAEVTKEIPKSAKYQNNTKVFKEWKEAVPKAGTVEAKTFTAVYKANKELKDAKTKALADLAKLDSLTNEEKENFKELINQAQEKTKVDEVLKQAKAKNTANKEAKDKKELEDAKEALKPIIEKKFQDPKQKASVLKDLAKLKTLKEVEQLKADIEGSATIGEHNYAKKLAEAKKELESIIEKKFQDPKQKASVLKDLAKLKTLEEVEQLKADIEGSTTIGEHNDAKKLAEAKEKAVKTVKELKKLTEEEKTKAIAEINKANTEAEVNEALEKAKELDKKHGAENPSVTPTPDVTPSPDVTPTPETKAGWQKDEKGWWYLRENGTYPAGEWEPVGEKWYHFDPQGYMQTGWLNLDGTWYYLNADGSMAKDTWIGTYYVDANGAWIVEGWQNSGYGWWYQRANGSYPSNEWEMINGIWYYFDANGYMLANTTTPDGYYVDENGAWVK